MDRARIVLVDFLRVQGGPESGARARKTTSERWDVSGLAKPRGQTFVAFEFDVVKRGSNAVPARCSCRLRAHNVRQRGHVNASPAQGTVNQRHLEFDGCARGDWPRAKKIHSGRTDVPRHERNRERLQVAGHAPQSQRQSQLGARVAPLFGMYPHDMCWHSLKPAGLRPADERTNAQKRRTRFRRGPGRRFGF